MYAAATILMLEAFDNFIQRLPAYLNIRLILLVHLVLHHVVLQQCVINIVLLLVPPEACLALLAGVPVDAVLCIVAGRW